MNEIKCTLMVLDGAKNSYTGGFKRSNTDRGDRENQRNNEASWHASSQTNMRVCVCFYVLLNSDVIRTVQ